MDVFNSMLSANAKFGCQHYTLVLGQSNTSYSQKHSGKVHLFPKFPLLLVTLNRHEISSVNHCNKTLRDSALFEVEWVARSFTFPAPV